MLKKRLTNKRRAFSNLLCLRMLLLFLVLGGASIAASADSKAFEISVEDICVQLSPDGQITGIRLGKEATVRAVIGGTAIGGCRAKGKVSRHEFEQGGIEFKRHFVQEGSRSRCTLVERFTPSDDSIRWEIEIQGEREPWSAAIETRLIWDKPQTATVWTAWGDSRPKKSPAWCDPLLPTPFANLELVYGARRYSDPKAISIPLVTVLDEAKDTALSLALSPEDLILDMKLNVTERGQFVFSRTNHRISAERPVGFAMDLVAHPADWRGGLGWMVRRYPAFFEPSNPAAHGMAGCGAYSSSNAENMDAETLMRMAFRINWKASFDFPYMGMFVPPVKSDDEEWTDFKNQQTSIARMREYSRRMRAMGFHTLNYFNVTEFGAHFQYPPPPRKAKHDEDLWKDAQDFLYYALGEAILPGREGKPIGSWEGCVAMDPGEPVYQNFLIDQVERHIAVFPESSGICIDRMDWLTFYNSRRDDGVSWVDGKPARSLVTSWHEIMSKIGPMMHDTGKVIFCNPHYRRVDLLRHVDGVYDEFGQMPHSLNLCALLCVQKPVLAWTILTDDLRDTPDAYFQRHLHLGVYLTAPVPGNDHTILPDGRIEQFYLDYGPMLDALRGKRWVLTPHVVEVPGNEAKANLFSVPGGYVVPVTFGGNLSEANVVLRGLPKLSGQSSFRIEALHPGRSDWVPVVSVDKGDALILRVPLRRGCAMVRLAYAWLKPEARYFTSPVAVEMGTTLSCVEIHYTLDGPEPSAASPLYTGPIPISASTNVAMAAYRNAERVGDVLSAEFVRLPPP